MFQAEVRQAIGELQRPAPVLVASGIVAGICVGIGVLLLGAMLTHHGGLPEGIAHRLLVGSAYAVGFVLAILGRTDLFTEYTTIAIFPILTGDSRMRQLARLWGLVYVGNLAGGFAAAILVALLGPAMGVVEPGVLGALAGKLAAARWWIMLLSGVAAGWLMGVLSWLIAGGRDTTSQVLFIWIVGTTIGFLGLHHAITGGVEMFAGALADPDVTWRDVAHVLIWTTLGNSLGGALFAVLIRQGVQLRSD